MVQGRSVAGAAYLTVAVARIRIDGAALRTWVRDAIWVILGVLSDGTCCRDASVPSTYNRLDGRHALLCAPRAFMLAGFLVDFLFAPATFVGSHPAHRKHCAKASQ
jgi:hypothetical protein